MAANWQCKLGLHDLSWKWKEPNNQYNCDQIAICRRCDLEKTREKHQTGEKKDYLTDNSCVEVPVCERCDQKVDSSRYHIFITHDDWGSWEYQNFDSCVEFRICARCGERGTREIHEWGEWEHESDSSCNLIQKCLRCNNINKDLNDVPIYADEQEHNWGEWHFDTSKNTSVKVCKRCGSLQYSYSDE